MKFIKNDLYSIMKLADQLNKADVPTKKRYFRLPDGSTVTNDKTFLRSLNVDFTAKGEIKKRKGWKSFKGMVYQLKLINKRYKKMGVSGDFTIRLPLN